MRIIMVAAVSADGFIADKNGNVTDWTSTEDKEFFSQIKTEYPLIVMGSTTYDKLPKPLSAEPKRIVLTSNPPRYFKDSSDSVMFVDFSPIEFYEKFSKEYETCLHLGGSRAYDSFLKEGLIDEIYLTHEPTVLGGGTPIVSSGKLELSAFDQIESRPLNDQGTILEHYVKKRL